MGMYSGIGSFAKRFQTGGEAETTTNGSGSGLDTIGDASGSGDGLGDAEVSDDSNKTGTSLS